MKSFRPVHSRMTSVMTQPGFEWLTMTFPFLEEDAVTRSAISWTAYISRSLERLYLKPRSVHFGRSVDGVGVPFYLSSILAFFSSASASNILSSSRSGNCVIQWTKDVTNTSLGSVSSHPIESALIAHGKSVRQRQFEVYKGNRRALCSQNVFHKPTHI